jgi:hypothetical protein
MIAIMTIPMTGAQLARELGMSRARAHYHLKLLEKVGVVKFCGEGLSHGIVEKYYHTVARMLDFSKLISSDRQDLIPDEITLQSFQAVTNFLATMLDVSKESILNFEKHKSLETSFYFDYASVLTLEQVKLIKQKLISLKQLILDMSRENENNLSDVPSPFKRFRTTFFLTPSSNIPEEDT